MATITHQKVDNIPSWDATDLANAKAGNPPGIPASATIADIVLSEDWNADHVLVLGADENFVTDAELLETKLSLSAGVITGGQLSIGTPTSTFSISDGNGVIVDAYTSPNAPVVYEVSWTGLSNIAVTNIATETQTYVFLDNTGAVIQTNVEPTDAQHRDYIFLGQLAHTNFTSVTTVISTPDVMASPVNQLRDLEKAIGVINDGNSVYANGANLNLNKTAGILYMNGINFYTDNKTPSEKSYAAATGISWRYRTQDGSGSTVSAIDPNNYDLAGTITALIGTQATNQRVYLTIGGNVVIQYGQTVHASLVDAIAGLSSETFVVYPNLETASLIGVIAVERNTTDLTNTAKARFLSVSKFGEVTGSAAGISVSTLQNAYNNSTTPEILTDATRGAVTVKRGSAADTDTIYEGLNGAGSTTFSVKGDGTVTAVSDINITTAGEALNVTGNFGGSSIYSGDGAVIRSSSGIPIDLRINGAGAVSTEILKLDSQTNNSNFFTRYYVNGTVSGYIQNTGAYTAPLEFNTVGGLFLSGGNVTVKPTTDSPSTLTVNTSFNYPAVQLGSYPSFPAFGGLWAGNITPGSTNYAFISDGGANTMFNVPDSSGNIYFRAAHVTVGTINTSGMRLEKSASASMGARMIVANTAAAASGNEASFAFQVNSNFSAPYYTAQVKSINTAASNANRLGFFLYLNSDGTAEGLERVSILDTGYVGIGTTTPNTPLQISNTAEAKIRLSGGSSQNGMAFDAVNGSNEFYLYTGDPFGNGGNFGIYNVTTAAQLFTILDNGNVGVGTSTPVNKFHVVSADAANAVLFAGATKGVRIGLSSGGALIEGVDSTGTGSYQSLDIGGSVLNFDIAGVQKMVLSAAGKLGINVASPTAYLHLPAGTTSANTAPLKITLGGALNTTPEAGAVEATNTHIYWTDSGGTRYQLDQQGGGTGAANTYNETPTGLVNSSNTVYTAAANFNTGTTRVYLNGLRQALGVDYTETGADEITFTTAPTTGDNLFLDYEVA